ncbi:hypothetical protein LXL04_025226 [Taraxacum kok-saghyz]
MIHVAMNLIKRGVNLPVTSCPFCLSVDENIDHLFFGCNFSVVFWNWFHKWENLLTWPPLNINDIVLKLNCSGLSKKFKKLKLGLIYSVIWSIWKARNFILTHRANITSLDWNAWCCSPYASGSMDLLECWLLLVVGGKSTVKYQIFQRIDKKIFIYKVISVLQITQGIRRFGEICKGKGAKTSAVCRPHLQSSAEEEKINPIVQKEEGDYLREEEFVRKKKAATRGLTSAAEGEIEKWFEDIGQVCTIKRTRRRFKVCGLLKNKRTARAYVCALSAWRRHKSTCRSRGEGAIAFYSQMGNYVFSNCEIEEETDLSVKKFSFPEVKEIKEVGYGGGGRRSRVLLTEATRTPSIMHAKIRKDRWRQRKETAHKKMYKEIQRKGRKWTEEKRKGFHSA